jgi:hypothetical protein
MAPVSRQGQTVRASSASLKGPFDLDLIGIAILAIYPSRRWLPSVFTESVSQNQTRCAGCSPFFAANPRRPTNCRELRTLVLRILDFEKGDLYSRLINVRPNQSLSEQPRWPSFSLAPPHPRANH